MGAANVRIDERVGPVDGAVDVGFRRKMHDGVDTLALHDLSHRVSIADVRLDEREAGVVGDGLEARKIPRVRKRIQAYDRIAGMMLDPVMNEVRADEAGRSRDEQSTHCQKSLGSFVMAELDCGPSARGKPSS